jgi:EmrB/QacA subfamily drug resistance transporter
LISSPSSSAKTSSRWVLAATILASSMAFIDGTVVNVALPALQADLHATANSLQWVVESYALFLASLLLLGGSAGDLYGRRKCFVFGVLVFAVGSMCCGFAPSIGILIAARAFQGVGAAFLVPGSLAIITASFPASERGAAIGTWSGFTAITTAIGPMFGGWLVQHISWRCVFFINLPVAAAVVWLAHAHVRESRDEESNRRIDWPGALLVTGGLGAVTFSLIQASVDRVAARWCGLVGIVLIATFVLVEMRSASPMISPRLFRSRDFAGTNLFTLMLYGALGGVLFFLPLELIQVQHYSATKAGASLLPLVVLISLFSRWSGGLIATYGARLPLTLGPLIAAAGFMLMLRCGLPASYWTTVFPAVLTLGLGLAITVAPLTTAVMQSLPAVEAGVASGVNNAVSRMAALLAVAVFGLVLTAGFNHSLDGAVRQMAVSSENRQALARERAKLAGAEIEDPQLRVALDRAFVVGFHDVIWISAALAVLSAFSAQMLSPKSVTSSPA